MLKKFLLSAEHLFDKKLKNGTLMVLIISTCVVGIGILNQGVSAHMHANILQSQAQSNTLKETYIIIEGKRYKVVLEEVTE